jgi:geranylgeranyl reductase family protein
VDLWDVIVVGAGPAGSSAARVAAENGARVLLLDKARFPRYKTCGGGLIGISLEYLPASVLRTIEQQATSVRFTLRGRSANTHRARSPFLGLVQREIFDQALVDAAVAAGVEFRDGVSVRGISEDDGGVVTLSTSVGEFRGKTVIGADGAGGRIGRYVGVIAGGTDLALEHEIIRPADGRSWDDRVYLDWGTDAGTYAWMFPKTESLTVGVIQKRGLPDETRAYLDRYTRELGLADAVVTRSSGHLAQWRSDDSPLRRGNVIVAGDTAALLDPFTREGISFALRSGTWAGEAAASKNLAGYVTRVEEELAPDIAASATLLRLFERRPGLVHAGLSYTIIGARIFIAVCSGRVTMAELYRSPVARVLRRVLSTR